MTAATPPPPRDGEVCQCGHERDDHDDGTAHCGANEWCNCDAFVPVCAEPMRGGPNSGLPCALPRGHNDGIHNRPAAPSEPMDLMGNLRRSLERAKRPAADSPTPGVGSCRCGHGEPSHRHPEGLCAACQLCTGFRPAAPSEPPAADSPTAGTETCREWVVTRRCARPEGHTGLHRNGDQIAGVATYCPAPSPVDATEPPAEAQQDERPRWISGEMSEPWHRDLVASTTAQHAADLTSWAERVATTYGRSGSLEVTAVIWALLDQLDAARPSADTETLLASVLRKLIADKHVFLALSTHRRDSGMPVQFTLDDTTVGITDAEADAVKREAGW